VRIRRTVRIHPPGSAETAGQGENGYSKTFRVDPDRVQQMLDVLAPLYRKHPVLRSRGVALSRLRRWGGLVLTQAVSAARMLSLTAGLERRQADERRRYGRTLSDRLARSSAFDRLSILWVYDHLYSLYLHRMSDARRSQAFGLTLASRTPLSTY
jgi:hypothetical protein